MKDRIVLLLIAIVLLISGLTGCLDDDDEENGDDVPSSVPAPVWTPGKFWVYTFTTPDETDIATRLVVAPDDGTNHLVGSATTEEAQRHAVLNYNPLLGRVELNNFSVYEKGEPQTLFKFPLEKGNSWTFDFLDVEGWQASVVSIKKFTTPAMGETVIVDIHANAPGGEVMDYSFDVEAGWVHLMRAQDAGGETLVNMTLVSYGSGWSGDVYFMRGLDLFDEEYQSPPPVHDRYDTFMDSGHPDHGAFDTLVIFLNFDISGGSSGSLAIRDPSSEVAFTRTWTTETTGTEIANIPDESGEFGVTVNLDGACYLRVRIAGGIWYTWTI